MADNKLIAVEIAYAKPEQQIIISKQVNDGSTVAQAIDESGILGKFPEINLNDTKVGIFGKVCKLQQVLKEGDRIEIYRHLLIEPKEHRRQRAAKGKDIQVDDSID